MIKIILTIVTTQLLTRNCLKFDTGFGSFTADVEPEFDEQKIKMSKFEINMKKREYPNEKDLWTEIHIYEFVSLQSHPNITQMSSTPPIGYLLKIPNFSLTQKSSMKTFKKILIYHVSLMQRPRSSRPLHASDQRYADITLE